MKTPLELPGGTPLEFCEIPGKPYLLGRYPVTQEQYHAITGVNPSYLKGDKLPVEKVSWDDATRYCQMLSEHSGQTVRLPTEAEWEHACRAGSTTEYYTGDGEEALARAGWYWGNSKRKTHPVGKKEPNAWGLHDMHGNVWEWCRDVVGDRHRVLRGGSWCVTAWRCRSAFRYRWWPDDRDWNCGFRVCLGY
jgi:formylglycine-generating enzyme required for sulfatase activity